MDEDIEIAAGSTVGSKAKGAERTPAENESKRSAVVLEHHFEDQRWRFGLRVKRLLKKRRRDIPSDRYPELAELAKKAKATTMER